VVTVSHKERGRGGGRGSHGGLMRRQRRVEIGRCRRKVMIGGAHLSARRGVKAVRGEAFSHEGGGNRVGHHRRAVGWAETASWADREAEA
jgi:hypothetical protein